MSEPAVHVDADQLEILQKLGKYRAAITRLKRSAVFGIFFGLTTALTVTGAAQQLPTDPPSAVLLAIAVAILGVSLWQIICPLLSGLLAEGMLIMALGVWSIVVGLLVTQGFWSLIAPWATFGCVQIGVALHEFQRYSRLRKRFPEKPSREAVRFVNELVLWLFARRGKRDDNVVEFQSVSLLAQRRRWRGVLLGDSAIFVSRQRDVMAAHKPKIWLTRGRKLFLQRVYNVVLRAGDVAYTGIMPRWSLERFKAWQAAPEPEAAARPATGTDVRGATDENGSADLNSVSSLLR